MTTLGPETHPQTITGGCLCGSIRYTIDYTAAPWPPQSATCQCTMCRKWTSSLTAQFIVVQPQHLTPDPRNNPAYAEYESSPRRFRGFCSRCGSSLVWRSDENVDTWDLFLGTVDEEWLVGSRGERGRREGAEFGVQLATPNQFQCYWENAIRGVTDRVEGGKRFWGEFTGEAVGGTGVDGLENEMA